MLSRANRLSLRLERGRLEKEGKTYHSPIFILISAPSSVERDSLSRFAILVSKKTAPLSVARHRLRRIVGEVLRHNLDKFPNNQDFILIPKKSILVSTPSQILSDLLTLVRNSK